MLYYMILCLQTIIHSYYEQWAQCANGLPRSRRLRPAAGWRWDGLQGLGSAQLSGAGHLQPPLGPGSLMEEALPQQGQAQSLQPNLSPTVWLCHGEYMTLCDKCELSNVCDPCHGHTLLWLVFQWMNQETVAKLKNLWVVEIRRSIRWFGDKIVLNHCPMELCVSNHFWPRWSITVTFHLTGSIFHIHFLHRDFKHSSVKSYETKQFWDEL